MTALHKINNSASCAAYCELRYPIRDVLLLRLVLQALQHFARLANARASPLAAGNGRGGVCDHTLAA
eukprot:2120970-Lingulodinium_polyedra.AAC.1